MTPAEHAATVHAALDALQAQAEAAQREADIQMGAKLAAQMTLKAVCDVLNLPMVSLGNGWTEATPKILARIETIVDEADRGFRERDAAEAELATATTTMALLRARVTELEAALRELLDDIEVLRDDTRPVRRAATVNGVTLARARAALATDKEQK